MKFKASNRLNIVEEYYFSKKLQEIAKLKSQGKDIINLGIGSPDLPPHPNVINTLNENSKKHNTHGYQGYKGIPELRNQFASFYKKFYNVNLDGENEVLPLIGSKEGIFHISMTFLNDGDCVLVPNPGYPSYSAVTNLCGGVPIIYDLEEKNNWLPDLKKIEKNLNKKVKLMWINYPNMPTGKKASKNELLELINFAERNNILLINDNPYSFVLNDEPLSILSVENGIENCLELNSLSKSFNMAGWRVGAILGKKEYIDLILKFKSNLDSGTFLPVQLAATEALKMEKDWFISLNNIYLERKIEAVKILDYIDAKYDINQTGMFLWAKINDKHKDGYTLSDKILYDANVFITPGGIFGTNGNNYIRISLCSSKEIFITALERIKKINL